MSIDSLWSTFKSDPYLYLSLCVISFATSFITSILATVVFLYFVK